MNMVRLLRAKASITQQDLAIRAGTSQPTIAAYEAGRKSPTVATLQRLASALGLEVTFTYVPKMTREDRRSLAYHRIVAEILARKPRSSLERAQRNLKKMVNLHPHAGELFDRWRRWLKLPPDELILRFLDPGLTARDMRQVSPFAGLLEPRERASILKEFRRERDSQ